MNITQAEILTKDLMAKHGLDSSWKFEWSNGQRVFGWCSSAKRTIKLSKTLTALNSQEHVKDVILHEIAHALAGARNGHNKTWKRVAKSIGCTGTRTYSNEVVRPARTYIGVCPNGHKTESFRRNRLSCSKCDKNFNEKYLFEWQRR